jgi:hypothetical protein
MYLNLALSAIFIITIVVFPGIVFKRFYFQGQFSKQFGGGLFADRIITSIFWGLFIQSLAITFFYYTTASDFDAYKSVIVNTYATISNNELPNVSKEFLIYWLVYIFIVITISISLGFILHTLIRIFGLDVKFPVLRYANHWHYYFKGEILSTKKFQKLKRGKVLSTKADIIVSTQDKNGKNTLFTGFITDYSLSNKTGELEFLYLTESKKYKEEDKVFKEFESDCLVIPFSKVENLNLRYIYKKSVNRKRQIIKKLKNLSFFTIFFSIIILPWFIDFNISVLRTFLGIITGLLTYLFIVTFITRIIEKRPKLNNRWEVVSYIIVILLFFFFTKLFFRL